MKEKILEILQQKHQLSGGNCGIYLPNICSLLNVEYYQIKDIIHNLLEEKLIELREGSHGQLIFLKIQK